MNLKIVKEGFGLKDGEDGEGLGLKPAEDDDEGFGVEDTDDNM